MKFVYKFIQFFVDIIDQVMWQGGRPLGKAALWAVLYEGRFVGGFVRRPLVGGFLAQAACGRFCTKAALWAVLYEGRFVGGFVRGRFVGGFVRRPLCGRFCTKAALWAVLYKGRFVGGFIPKAALWAVLVRRPLCGRFCTEGRFVGGFFFLRPLCGPFCTKAALWAVYLTHNNLMYYITISYVYI